MNIDSVLLFLILLRHGYETKPFKYALLKGWLEQFPETLPEGYRRPIDVVHLIDTLLSTTTTSTRVNDQVRSIDDQVRQLREFASRFSN